MLSRNRFLMLIMVGFIMSVFVTNVMGENLVVFYKDKDGIVNYYDKDSVKRKSELVKVWTQIGFNKKNKGWKSWVGLCVNKSKLNSNHDCNRLYLVKSLRELNCKEDMIRIVSIVIYDEDGKSLDSYDNSSSEFYSIVPTSIDDGLKNSVCK